MVAAGKTLGGYWGKKGSLVMKTKLFFSILVLATVAPIALASGDQGATNVFVGKDQSLVIPAENLAGAKTPTGSEIVPADPKQSLQDYDSTLMAITEKFTGTLTSIADAIKRGELTTDQGREMSAEQYQIVQMQFELVSLWRQMEERDSLKLPTVQANPDLEHGLRQQNETVVVELPFSSLQLDPSVVEYLDLTASQADAIQKVMTQELQNLEPLMTELQVTRDKLFAAASQHINESEIKGLADREASALARLIVANARMQSKIYKVLSPNQQEKLSDLERSQSTVTPNTK